MSLGLIHIFNDPARFGRIPDPPEYRCAEEETGEMIDDRCRYCSNEKECRELWGEEDEEVPHAT